MIHPLSARLHTLSLDILISMFRPRPVWGASLETAPSTSTAQTLPVWPAPTLSLSAPLATTLLPDPIPLHRPLFQSHSLVVPALCLSASVQLLLVLSRSYGEPGCFGTEVGTMGCCDALFYLVFQHGFYVAVLYNSKSMISVRCGHDERVINGRGSENQLKRSTCILVFACTLTPYRNGIVGKGSHNIFS